MFDPQPFYLRDLFAEPDAEFFPDALGVTTERLDEVHDLCWKSLEELANSQRSELRLATFDPMQVLRYAIQHHGLVHRNRGEVLLFGMLVSAMCTYWNNLHLLEVNFHRNMRVLTVERFTWLTTQLRQAVHELLAEDVQSDYLPSLVLQRLGGLELQGAHELHVLAVTLQCYTQLRQVYLTCHEHEGVDEAELPDDYFEEPTGEPTAPRTRYDVDHLLDKIHQLGVESLTQEERNFLDEHSGEDR